MASTVIKKLLQSKSYLGADVLADKGDSITLSANAKDIFAEIEFTQSDGEVDITLEHSKDGKIWHDWHTIATMSATENKLETLTANSLSYIRTSIDAVKGGDITVDLQVSVTLIFNPTK